MIFRIITFSLLIFTVTVQVNAQSNVRGSKLFTDQKLCGGTTGKTCLTCHAKGRDFTAGTLKKMHYIVMGVEINSLPEVINFCIEVALRGEGLNTEGEEMKDLITYLEIFIKENTLEKNP